MEQPYQTRTRSRVRSKVSFAGGWPSLSGAIKQGCPTLPAFCAGGWACAEPLLLQFLKPPREELPLWFLLRQRQCLLIRRPSLRRPAQPAVHIRTGRMCQVIIGQFALL